MKNPTVYGIQKKFQPKSATFIVLLLHYFDSSTRVGTTVEHT